MERISCYCQLDIGVSAPTWSLLTQWAGKFSLPTSTPTWHSLMGSWWMQEHLVTTSLVWKSGLTTQPLQAWIRMHSQFFFCGVWLNWRGYCLKVFTFPRLLLSESFAWRNHNFFSVFLFICNGLHSLLSPGGWLLQLQVWDTRGTENTQDLITVLFLKFQGL